MHRGGNEHEGVHGGGGTTGGGTGVFVHVGVRVHVGGVLMSVFARGLGSGWAGVGCANSVCK